MSVVRLLSAIRGAFEGKGQIHAQALPNSDIPPVPLPGSQPDSWRDHCSTRGPYTRFRVSYPRGWQTTSLSESDALHLEPSDGSRSTSVTFSFAAVPVFGPQGLLDALELLAESRGVRWIRSSARVDRWGDDAWAASWGWLESGGDSPPRPTWVVLVGHDQGMVFVTASGSRKEFDRSRGELSEIISSLRLSPATTLSPEQFPSALCELLNDRRAQGEHYWTFSDNGRLISRKLEVRLWDLYRAYLIDGDLDDIASALDARDRNAIETRWAGCDFESVRSQVRVVLRRRETVGELPIVQIPIAGELVACPVLDTDDRMTFIPQMEAERWGVSPSELLQSAVRALDRAGQLELLELKSPDGQDIDGFLMADDDGYDSGRLLSPRIRKLLSELLGGPLIVAVPAAGVVLIARDYDFARNYLAKASLEAFECRPRPLSRQLWRWTEEGLEPLEV
jgi:hypothetical protein